MASAWFRCSTCCSIICLFSSAFLLSLVLSMPALLALGIALLFHKRSWIFAKDEWQSLGQAVWLEQGPWAWDGYIGCVRKKEESKGQSWDIPTGRDKGKATVGRVIAVDLLLLAPEVGGCFCVSSGHWRWCGLPDFCLSERGGQGTAVCAPGPSCFHCSGESKFAVISVPVIKLNVNLCWSSWKESWKEQLPEQAGWEWEWEYIMVDLLVHMPLFSKWILQQLEHCAGI